MILFKPSRMAFFSYLVLIFIVASVQVFAVGISPAKMSFTLYPGENQTASFTVFSTEEVPQAATLELKPWVGSEDEVPRVKEKQMLKYLKIDKPSVPLQPGERTDVMLTAKYPDEDLEPGNYEYQILFTQGRPAKGGFIVALGAVRVPLNVWIKKRGKFVHAYLAPAPAKEGGAVPLELRVNNWGTEDIDSVKGTVEIYESVDMKERVALIDMGSAPLIRDEGITLKGVWNTVPGTKGAFFAVGTVDFDGAKIMVNQSIKFGTLNLRLIRFPQNLQLGGVVPVAFEVQNEWPAPLENLFADVTLKENGDVKASFTASERRVESLSKTTLKGYLDTAKLRNAMYDVEIALSFNEVGSQDKHTVQIKGKTELLPPPKTEQPGVVASETASGTPTTSVSKSSGSLSPTVLVLAVIVIGLVSIIFWMGRRKHDDFY